MKRSEISIVTSIAALSLALSAGCFSSSSGAPPSEGDASPLDAESGDDAEAPSDATIEASPDAGGSSSGVDAAVEASTDAEAEAGADALVEATTEAGPIEAGPVEAGPVEAGPIEAGPVEAGPVEAGPIEAGPVEAGPVEAGPVEAGAVAIGTSNTQVIAVASNATLFINDNHAVWSYGSATQVSYVNLPAALAGTVGNDTVNTSTPVTFTLTATTTCYLIRQDGWTSVDLTGWVPTYHAAYYFTGYDNGTYGNATIYVQTFPAGVYNWNTYSAMYACAE